MIYSEQQLERFSKPPFKYEKQQVIDTHTEIRTAITNFYDRGSAKTKFNLVDLPDLDPFLQGSYSNDTNITKSSDVDVVIRIKNVWKAKTDSLSADELVNYKNNSRDCQYSFHAFNMDIMKSLQEHFGSQYIVNDSKCLRLRKHSKFCDADVIPALTYKLYRRFPSSDRQIFSEGICFDTNEGKTIINFPKLHQESLTNKSEKTNGNFKETVRMFKNLKCELVENRIISNDVAKSYFIENLLYNILDSLFAGTYSERFSNILSKLVRDFNDGTINNYSCANGIDKLLSETTWSNEYLRQFLIGLIKIRDENSL